jgi:hypothetical protein
MVANIKLKVNRASGGAEFFEKKHPYKSGGQRAA